MPSAINLPTTSSLDYFLGLKDSGSGLAGPVRVTTANIGTQIGGIVEAAVEALLQAAIQDALDNSVFVNVLNNSLGYELTGDGSTDDGPNLNSLIGAVPDGATLFFPTAPGGFYKISTEIVWPSAKSISFRGEGSGESGDSRLRAGTAMSTIISKTNTFSRGGSIKDMIIDGNGVADYCVNFGQAAVFTFDDVLIHDALVTNLIVGDGVGNTQEVRLNNLRITNYIPTALSNLPDYNLILRGTNNNALNVKCSNAKLANILEDSGSADNVWNAVHGYNYLTGGSPYQAPANNIASFGTGSQWLGWECDGSTSVNFRVGATQIKVMCGVSQFDNVTAQIGLQFDNGVNGCAVIGNTFRGSSSGNCIVQSGSAGSGGNITLGSNWRAIDSSWI